MNPVTLEHLSRVENARRARQTEHLPLLNQASANARPAEITVLRAARGLQARLSAALKSLKHRLSRHQDQWFGVGGDT
jgi:hypothetical protein